MLDSPPPGGSIAIGSMQSEMHSEILVKMKNLKKKGWCSYKHIKAYNLLLLKIYIYIDNWATWRFLQNRHID